MLTVHGKH